MHIGLSQKVQYLLSYTNFIIKKSFNSIQFNSISQIEEVIFQWKESIKSY